MRREPLEFLCCPACRADLRVSNGDRMADAMGELSCTGCERRWPVEDGVPNLVFPEELEENDAASRRLWDRVGRFYDWIGRATNLMRGVPLATERRNLVDRLGLTPGSAVLETAAGTGENLLVIAEQFGDQVTAFGVDLSGRMIRRAVRKLSKMARPPALVLANSVCLPFRDRSFDAVLDGFGMKYYSDKGRAMREMLRVVKPRGKVVVAELGVPNGQARNLRQRLLALWIPHFREAPPLQVIPEGASGLSLSWDSHETAYVIEFRRPEV